MAILLPNFRTQRKLIISEAKICKLCPETGVQPLENFCKNSRSPGGRKGVCKNCEKKKRTEKETERKLYTGI
jgi:hypothetical protein